MKRPTVLHVDLGRTWRGGQQQAYLLHRELQTRGVGTLLAAPLGSALLTRCLAEGLPSLPLPGRSQWDPRVLRDLWRGIHKREIFHAHDAHAAALGALLRSGRPGFRLICHRRVSYAPSSNPWSRWKYARADLWIAVSREVASVLAAYGAAVENTRVVHSAIDVAAFRAAGAAADRTALRRELGLPEGAWVVGFCAAFSPQKGHAVLLDAAQRVLDREPKLVFLLAGEGTLREGIARRVSESSLSAAFRFPGHRSDVAALTGLFDVGVVPSVDGEGSSASIKEPMALGIPVVASDLPGNLEVLGDGGLSFRRGDPAELAACLLRLLGDHDLRAGLAERARCRAERFSVEAMAEGVLAAYRAVLP